MKKKMILFFSFLMILIAASALYLKWDTIFQRGNPIPYVMAMTQLSDENTYAAVNDGENVYISKRGEYKQLFEDFQERNKIAFSDQLGSGYLFTNGTDNFVVLSEIYWSRYTVWVLPDMPQ